EAGLWFVGRRSAHASLPLQRNLDECVGDVLVVRNRKVQRRRAFPDPSRRIVVRAVAGAVPAAKLANTTLRRPDRNAPEVRTGAGGNQDRRIERPVGLRNQALVVGFRVTKGCDIDGPRLGAQIGRAACRGRGGGAGGGRRRGGRPGGGR